jgi:hypothetical protein
VHKESDPFLLLELPCVAELHEALHYHANLSSYFSKEHYREQLAGISIEIVDFLGDFVKSGLQLSIKLSPLFDPLWYYRSLAACRVEAFS